MTTQAVKIIECPRDAWQAMPHIIPAETKAAYLRALVAAGFRHIDAVSFVSPAAVPQMADSEQVLELLGTNLNAEIIGIVVNEQGAERAMRTEAVGTLGFPYSLSATFLERNQRQTPSQARQTLEAIHRKAIQGGLGMVVYLSMAFGNPYGDPWRPEAVVEVCRMLHETGIREISLADTVGMARPEQIRSLLQAVSEAVPGIELGAHLHARADQTGAATAAVYEAGCRRLDTSLGGHGGCPFAQDALVGNLATESALSALDALGAPLPALAPLATLLEMARAIAEKFGHASPRYTH